ncbi:15299_t:CDS:2 [Entrophospora sp. SA101]|nr:15299_t:CDS:2 [Entrophospora sp. SA101]
MINDESDEIINLADYYPQMDEEYLVLNRVWFISPKCQQDDVESLIGECDNEELRNALQGFTNFVGK